jgi:hypothetical protein
MYRTFKRSCVNWKQFGSTRKITDERGLTLEEARRRCDAFNNNRTAVQIKKGTKMEYEGE